MNDDGSFGPEISDLPPKSLLGYHRHAVEVQQKLQSRSEDPQLLHTYLEDRESAIYILRAHSAGFRIPTPFCVTKPTFPAPGAGDRAHRVSVYVMLSFPCRLERSADNRRYRSDSTRGPTFHCRQRPFSDPTVQIRLSTLLSPMSSMIE